MLFAEIIDQAGRRVHVGVIMAAGRDWVEISVPELLNLHATQEIRFLPTLLSHAVTAGWRTLDRIECGSRQGSPLSLFANKPVHALGRLRGRSVWPVGAVSKTILSNSRESSVSKLGNSSMAAISVVQAPDSCSRTIETSVSVYACAIWPMTRDT